MKTRLHIVRTRGGKFFSFYIGRYGIEAIWNLLPQRLGFCIYYAWPDAK